MADCDYCGASFEDEDALTAHLADAHRDDLGPIDERRVAAAEGESGLATELDAGILALGGLLVLALGVVGYAVAAGFGGGGGAPAAGEPYDVGSVHYHGGINVTIGGDQLDFSRPAFQNPQQYPAFHFEAGDGDEWHVHAKGVTLEYAMSTLGIEVTDSTVTYDGTTYGDDPGETVVVEVDGQPVSPSRYVLQKGDRIHVAASGADA